MKNLNRILQKVNARLELAVSYRDPNMRARHYKMNDIKNAFITKDSASSERGKPFELYLGDAEELKGFKEGSFPTLRSALQYCNDSYPELDVFNERGKQLSRGSGL